MRRRKIPYSSLGVRCLLLVELIGLAVAKHLPDVHWNSTNSLFERNPSAHHARLRGTPLRREAFPVIILNRHDRVDFLCPEVNSRNGASERLVVSMVSEMSFLECQLDSSAVDFLVCDEDSATRRRRVSLRDTPPSLGDAAANFASGHSYYFISTSNGLRSGFRNTQGGLCVTKNMRLKVDFPFDSTDNKLNEKTTPTPSIEYFIEEREADAAPLRSAPSPNEFAPTSQSLARNLADILQVPAEYVDFVRRQAVKGGTGAIEFPRGESPDSSKRPRFVTLDSSKRDQNFYSGTDNSVQTYPIEDRHADRDDSLFNKLFHNNNNNNNQKNNDNKIDTENNFVSMKVYVDDHTDSVNSAGRREIRVLSVLLSLAVGLLTLCRLLTF